MISTKFQLSSIAQEVEKARALAERMSEAHARIPAEPQFVTLITLLATATGSLRHAADMLEASVAYYRAAHELRTGFPPEVERPSLKVVEPDDPGE